MRGELDLTRQGHSKGAAATSTASLVSPCWSRTSNCHKKDASFVALPTHARMIQATWRMQHSFLTASTCEAGSEELAEPELQGRASGIGRSCVIATPKNRRLTSSDMSWGHCIAAWQTVSCRNSLMPAPRWFRAAANKKPGAAACSRKLSTCSARVRRA
jgi:hypothetical protein